MIVSRAKSRRSGSTSDQSRRTKIRRVTMTAHLDAQIADFTLYFRPDVLIGKIFRQMEVRAGEAVRSSVGDIFCFPDKSQVYVKIWKCTFLLTVVITMMKPRVKLVTIRQDGCLRWALLFSPHRPIEMPPKRQRTSQDAHSSNTDSEDFPPASQRVRNSSGGQSEPSQESQSRDDKRGRKKKPCSPDTRAKLDAKAAAVKARREAGIKLARGRPRKDSPTSLPQQNSQSQPESCDQVSSFL